MLSIWAFLLYIRLKLSCEVWVLSLRLIFFILGELTCGRDIDFMCWINIDTLKVNTSVTNKKFPNNLEFPPLVNCLGDFYETNKKLFKQFWSKNPAKWCFYFCWKKLLRIPIIFITETLMTSSTHFPKEKTG